MASIELTNVSKSYGDVSVLDSINLAIADGEFVVFVGPSGCGKSTLLRTIAGLEAVSEGTLAFDCVDTTHARPIERGVAMVFQNYALYPHMTVAENIGFGLRIKGMPKAERNETVRRAADALHLTKYLQRKPAALSGGERQRVAIGRAIVKQPRVFLFDEPLSNLDADLRSEMRLEITRLHRELRTTMIYVTHDQVEAMTLADRIVVLREGRIEQVGTPQALYHDPDNIFVARFLGSPRINVFENCTVDPRGAEMQLKIPGLSAIPAPPWARYAEPVMAGIRAHNLRLAPPRDDAPLLEVLQVEHLGDVAHVHLATEHAAKVIASVGAAHVPRVGEKLALTADPQDVLLFGADGLRIR